jgi:hypothetical protein
MRRGFAPALGAWLALLAVLAGLSLRGYGLFQVGTYADDSKYVLLARSLVSADRYALLTGPAPPIPTGYPFVFPLLLTPFIVHLPDALDAMTTLSLAATLVNVSLLVWGWPLLCRMTSRWWAFAIAALYALAPLTLGHTNMVMSEAIFSSFAWSALLVAELAARRQRRVWWHDVLLGFLVACALYTRTIGVALVAAVILRVLCDARALQRGAALLCGALLLVLPVLRLTSVQPHDLFPARYAESFGQPSLRGYDPAEDRLATRALRGLQAYATDVLREAILPFGGGERERQLGWQLGVANVAADVGALVTVLLLLGGVAQLRGGGLAPTVVLFEVFYVIGLLLWHVRLVRFLYPLQPFLVFHFLSGIRLVAAALVRRRGGHWPDRAVACTIVGLGLIAVYRDARPPQPSTDHVRDFRVGVSWLREHTPPDAVVMADESITIHLYTHRATVPQPTVTSAAELTQFLHTYRVSQVLIGPQREWQLDGIRRYDDYTRKTLLPLLEELTASGQLRLVYESTPRELVRIYDVRPAR